MGKVRSESIRLVKAAFTHAGIHPPRTVYHVVTSRDAEPPAEHAAVEPPHTATVDTSATRATADQLPHPQHATAAATGHFPYAANGTPARPTRDRVVQGKRVAVSVEPCVEH